MLSSFLLLLSPSLAHVCGPPDTTAALLSMFSTVLPVCPHKDANLSSPLADEVSVIPPDFSVCPSLAQHTVHVPPLWMLWGTSRASSWLQLSSNAGPRQGQRMTLVDFGKVPETCYDAIHALREPRATCVDTEPNHKIRKCKNTCC